MAAAIRHSWPSHSTARTVTRIVPSGAGSRCSGRMPTTTGVAGFGGSASPGGTATVAPSPSSTQRPSAEMVPSMVFMGGVPMNWATKTLAGAA